MTKITKHILEVRFKPDPLVIDKRGEIARQLADGDLPIWKIADNRIDFGNEQDESVSAFFGYKNFGITVNYPGKTERFVEASNSFVRNAWDYILKENIVRVGVRSSFLIEAGLSFKDTFEVYKKNVSKFSKGNFSGNLVDIGLLLNFANGDEYFNVLTGPMESEQAKTYFGEKNAKDYPENGIYVEVDYYKKDFEPFCKQKDITKVVTNGVKKSEEVAEYYLRLIQGKE